MGGEFDLLGHFGVTIPAAPSKTPTSTPCYGASQPPQRAMGIGGRGGVYLEAAIPAAGAAPYSVHRGKASSIKPPWALPKENPVIPFAPKTPRRPEDLPSASHPPVDHPHPPVDHPRSPTSDPGPRLAESVDGSGPARPPPSTAFIDLDPGTDYHGGASMYNTSNYAEAGSSCEMTPTTPSSPGASAAAPIRTHVSLASFRRAPSPPLPPPGTAARQRAAAAKVAGCASGSAGEGRIGSAPPSVARPPVDKRFLDGKGASAWGRAARGVCTTLPHSGRPPPEGPRVPGAHEPLRRSAADVYADALIASGDFDAATPNAMRPLPPSPYPIKAAMDVMRSPPASRILRATPPKPSTANGRPSSAPAHDDPRVTNDGPRHETVRVSAASSGEHSTGAALAAYEAPRAAGGAADGRDLGREWEGKLRPLNHKYAAPQAWRPNGAAPPVPTVTSVAFGRTSPAPKPPRPSSTRTPRSAKSTVSQEFPSSRAVVRAARTAAAAAQAAVARWTPPGGKKTTPRHTPQGGKSHPRRSAVHTMPTPDPITPKQRGHVGASPPGTPFDDADVSHVVAELAPADADIAGPDAATGEPQSPTEPSSRSPRSRFSAADVARIKQLVATNRTPKKEKPASSFDPETAAAEKLLVDADASWAGRQIFRPPSEQPRELSEPSQQLPGSFPGPSEQPNSFPAASQQPNSFPAASQQPNSFPAASEQPHDTPEPSRQPVESNPEASSEVDGFPEASERPAHNSFRAALEMFDGKRGLQGMHPSTATVADPPHNTFRSAVEASQAAAETGGQLSDSFPSGLEADDQPHSSQQHEETVNLPAATSPPLHAASSPDGPSGSRAPAAEATSLLLAVWKPPDAAGTSAEAAPLGAEAAGSSVETGASELGSDPMGRLKALAARIISDEEAAAYYLPPSARVERPTGVRSSMPESAAPSLVTPKKRTSYSLTSPEGTPLSGRALRENLAAAREESVSAFLESKSSPQRMLEASFGLQQ